MQTTRRKRGQIRNIIYAYSKKYQQHTNYIYMYIYIYISNGTKLYESIENFTGIKCARIMARPQAGSE